jgi:hypothetical protein
LAAVAPRRLSKEESRKRFRELRSLWNDYDPIGCMTPDAPLDEYEAYVGRMMRLLERDASVDGIVEYVKAEATGHIGLTWNADLEARTASFAARCRNWFEQGWHGTVA